MIVRLQGKIAEQGSNWLLIENGGITYEVLLPVASMQRLNEYIQPDGSIRLIIYHYHHVEPSRSIPVLIGFLNEVEKEFFQSFITVSGIGPKAALRALSQPISLIARAIDAGDVAFLRSLPGIGQQRAKEIVAKLQNKVGKFGLMKDTAAAPDPSAVASGIEEEAVAVLLQLGYKRQEAALMVKNALDKCQSACETAEELLNEVYKQKKTV
ncbi:MAG: Holliday junction branch migration protein RuvA [Deltaproteobacteria bacterium]